MFVTDLLGRDVLDAAGQKIGRVKDLVVDLGEHFPPVVALEMQDPALPSVPWDCVAEQYREVTLRVPLDRLPERRAGEREAGLGREFLDRQIVDVNGHRVVRVNDLRLAAVEGRLRLVGVDVGLRGLARRLGLEGAAEGIAHSLGLRLHTHLIDWRDVEPIPDARAPIHLRVPNERLARLKPADIADIITQLDPADRTRVFEALDVETAADTLSEIEPEVQVALIQSLESERASDILEEMEPDEAADILGDLPPEQSDELLRLMDADEAADVHELLVYEDDVAGGMMTTEFVALDGPMTAQEAVARLRELAPEAETIYYLYVMDPAGGIAGVLSLRDLILADPATLIADLMARDVESVAVDTPADEVAHIMARYNLLALPVVDEEQRLQGIVTVDDVLEILMPEEWRRRLPRLFKK